MIPRDCEAPTLLIKIYHALLIVLMLAGFLFLLILSTPELFVAKTLVGAVAVVFSAFMIIQNFVGDDYGD